MRVLSLSLVLCLTAGFVMLVPNSNVWAQTSQQQTNTNATSNTNSTNATNNQTNNTNQQGNQSGQECDWSEYKASLSGTESGGKYTVVNGICATGKYQFMPSTGKGLDSFKQADPMCRSFTCKSGTGLATDACGSVQEAMMDEFTSENLKAIKNTKPDCWATIGKTVTGYKCTKQGIKTLTCQVTPSGILAGAHIGGVPGVCSTLTSGKDYDDGKGCKTNGRYGTSRLYYVCYHGNKKVPGEQCTPKQYDMVSGQVSYDTVAHDAARSGISYVQEITDGTQPVWSDLSEGLRNVWVAALQMMTSQLTAAMMDQVTAVGMLFDAKHQLEVQREFQRLTAQAHKDYHPSAQMCVVGTFVRSLTESERYSDLTQIALSERMLDRETISGDVLTLEGSVSDYKSRLDHFIEKNCNEKDAGKGLDGNYGLSNLCKNGNKDAKRKDMDVDYTTQISAPLTIDVDFVKGGEPTAAEEDIMALLNNLFYNDPFPEIEPSKTQLKGMSQPLQNMRSIIAMRGIAQNSIANIVAEKTASPDAASAMPFIRALIKEFGLDQTEIDKLFGENPSYYAQMEILTKTLYQHPHFVMNLYDKPTNVKRIRAAMRAIKLMQDRDINEAMLRREMLLSMILEIRIREYQAEVLDSIRGQLGAGRGPVRRPNNNPAN